MNTNGYSRNRGVAAIVIFVVLAIIAMASVLIGGIIGWVMNIYKFCTADFEPTYKEEIIRGVGIPCAPIGMTAGWMSIGGEDEEDKPVQVSGDEMIQAFPEGKNENSQ